jgi:hypothetical protein
MIDVFAEVTFPLCFSSSYSKIKMTWLRENSTDTFQPVASLSEMPRRLLLPASGFPVGAPQHFRIQSESVRRDLVLRYAFCLLLVFFARLTSVGPVTRSTTQH